MILDDWNAFIAARNEIRKEEAQKSLKERSELLVNTILDPLSELKGCLIDFSCESIDELAYEESIEI